MAWRVLFFGTSSFAVPLLEALQKDERFTLTGIVTQPDRPVGRHAVLTASPVKQVANNWNIPLFTFEKARSDEAFETLSSLSFDVAIVASYGQILPQHVLDLAPHRFINLHGSILPFYRGASPIAEAIKQGDTETGITVMVMDAGMDHGDILEIARCPILPNDTTPVLSERLAALGATTLPNTTVRYLKGEITPIPQDHERATGCKLIKKEDGQIDPHEQSAIAIERLVRAYTPWPGVSMMHEGKRLRLHEVALSETAVQPGQLAVVNKELVLGCKTGALVLKQVQPENRSAMLGADFARGLRDL